MKCTYIMLLLLLPLMGFGQQYRTLSTSTFYLEGGGPGILYSVNYDKLFNFGNSPVKLAAGVGFAYEQYYDMMRSSYSAYYPHLTAVTVHRTTVPFRLALMYGKPPFYGGLGIGTAPSSVNWRQINQQYPEGEGDDYSTFFTNIQFRYQPQLGGLFYAISLNLLYSDDDYLDAFFARYFKTNNYDSGYMFWPGISLGYTFKAKKAIKRAQPRHYY